MSFKRKIKKAVKKAAPVVKPVVKAAVKKAIAPVAPKALPALKAASQILRKNALPIIGSVAPALPPPYNVVASIGAKAVLKGQLSTPKPNPTVKPVVTQTNTLDMPENSLNTPPAQSGGGLVESLLSLVGLG